MARGNKGRRHSKEAQSETREQAFEEAGQSETELGYEWLDLPELPDAAELRPAKHDQQPSLQDGDYNRLEGPWDSNNVYLKTHYKLLREDAIRPLREALSRVFSMADIKEDERQATIGIYDSVRT